MDFACPELTRDFRGLQVWLPLWVHGVAAFRTALDEKLDLARQAYRTLRRDPGFETPLHPVNGRYLLRLCVLSHCSHACHVREALAALTEVRREHALACNARTLGC